MLKEWTLINPNTPSHLEMVAASVGSQTLGKILKDQGKWSEAATELRTFLGKYALNKSEPEGWAAGDLAQVLMEMDSVTEAEAVLRPQLDKRLEGLSEEARRKVRKNDTMFLEIQLAECLLLQREFAQAEVSLLELRQRFDSFGELWHCEKTRVLFVLFALARSDHLQARWSNAVERWRQVLAYGHSDLDVGFQRGHWGRDSYFMALASLSLADALYELGTNSNETSSRTEAEHLQGEAETALNRCPHMMWMLGLGTYWPQHIRLRMQARNRQHSKSSIDATAEDRK